MTGPTLEIENSIATPRDVAAERALLGACMESTTAFRAGSAVVSAADFYEPRNGLLWATIGEMAAEGIPADPVLLSDRLRSGKLLTKAGGGPYLHELYAAARLEIGTAGYYARIIADCATRRRIVQAGQRMIQRATSGEGDPVQLVEDATEDVRGARDQRVGVEVLTAPVDEFMRSVPDAVDWVVPGLLARHDRLILTGGGGLGKSTLLRQIAVCAAAGIPPFDWAVDDPFDPVKVTLIDCENSDHQLKTSLWPLLTEARHAGLPVEDRLRIGGHGNPLNLLDAAQALSLLRTIDHDKPDLVYIGPVYKLHNDDPDKEAVVKKITGVLDAIRETGAALIGEAHPNKAHAHGGGMSPSGSGMWSWWPEFGLGLRLAADSDTTVRLCSLERWRIDRTDSKWPKWIQHDGKWPWARAKENPYFESNRGAA